MMMIISDGFSRSRSRKSRSRSRYDSMVTASKSKQEKALHCPYNLKHSQPCSFLNNAQIRLINLYLKLESGNFFHVQISFIPRKVLRNCKSKNQICRCSTF